MIGGWLLSDYQSGVGEDLYVQLYTATHYLIGYYKSGSG